MNINGISNRTMQAGQGAGTQETDAYSRNIQRQIADAQKKLQELSSREDMTPEDKMKKRQEIQKEMNDLKVQLRQHQMELRKEKQQAKESSNAGEDADMTSMLSADTARKQAKVQGSVAAKMRGKANVLKAEIKLDSGETAAKKQEQLADVEQKAMDATASQLSALGDASKAMKDVDHIEDDADKTQKDSQIERSDRTQPDDDTQTVETQPSAQPHVDAQVSAGKKVIKNNGVENVSRSDMTMEEYQEFFTKLMNSIPFDSSQGGCTEI